MKDSRNRHSSGSSHSNLKNLKQRKKMLVYSSILISVIVFGGLTALAFSKDNDLYAEGVTISNIDIGNLTQEQAKEKVNSEIDNIMNSNVHLTVEDYSDDLKLKDLGLIVSPEGALEEAYNVNRNGSIVKKLLNSFSSVNGFKFDIEHHWDDEKLLKEINDSVDSINDYAVDASFKISPQNTMIISNEKSGRVVDAEDLASQVKEMDIFSKNLKIEGKYVDQEPKLTAKQLEEQKITGLMSSYTTRFDPSQTARSQNVRLAAGALDKAVIKPGETLSFNKIVGERTVEAGYKDAYIIVNGEFVPGLAGGICQVSSTLYNTGLLANLPVAQRSSHDLAISYVPLGQDAAVAYPNLDLKFTNNTGGYLLIRSSVSNNSITIQLYGKVVPGQSVSISNTTDSVIPFDVKEIADETLARGEYNIKQVGQQGYLVSSTRTVKVNGKVVKTEPLQKSRYNPISKIVYIGG